MNKLHQKLGKISVFLIVFGFTALIMSCEGPEGPAGPEGPQGPAGKDATINCQECHNANTLLTAKILQYKQSGHYTGSAYARGTSGGCAQCHATSGFQQWTSGEEVTGTPDPTPPGCRACHNIHETYSEDDYGLRTTAAVTLMGDLTEGGTFDKGTGNLCAHCHQSRERGYGLEVNGAGNVTISSSHWGPHLGTQANVYIGNGGFEVPGSESYGNSPHTNGIANSCVDCHLVDANHTFGPNDDACVTCHGEDFDYSDFTGEIETLIEELAMHLVDAGVLEGEEGEYHPVSGAETTHNIAGALFNYFIVVNDGSHGVHNPKYVKALLQNSIEVFE